MASAKGTIYPPATSRGSRKRKPTE